MDFPSFNYKYTFHTYGPVPAVPDGSFWSSAGFLNTLESGNGALSSGFAL